MQKGNKFTAIASIISLICTSLIIYPVSIHAQTNSGPVKVEIQRTSAGLEVTVNDDSGESKVSDFKVCGPQDYQEVSLLDQTPDTIGPPPPAGTEPGGPTTTTPVSTEPSGTEPEGGTASGSPGGGTPSESETSQTSAGGSPQTQPLQQSVTTIQNQIQTLQAAVTTLVSSMSTNQPPTKQQTIEWGQLYQQIQETTDDVYELMDAASDPEGECEEAAAFIQQQGGWENVVAELNESAGEQERESDHENLLDILFGKNAWAANTWLLPGFREKLEKDQAKLREEIEDIDKKIKGGGLAAGEEEKLRAEWTKKIDKLKKVDAVLGWCPQRDQLLFGPNGAVPQLQNLIAQLNGAGGAGGGGPVFGGGGGPAFGGGGMSGGRGGGGRSLGLGFIPGGKGKPGAGAGPTGGGVGGAPPTTALYCPGDNKPCVPCALSSTAQGGLLPCGTAPGTVGGGGVLTDPVAAKSAQEVAALAQQMLDLVKGNPSVDEIQNLRADVAAKLAEVNGHLQEQKCNA